MATWYIRHGKWWMVQWCWDGWLSLGIHIDLRRRVTSQTKECYGPYLDIHFGWGIFSIGYQPYYSGDHAANHIGRGGERAD